MENLFNNIYKNKTVLVTGHTGFKGSWLSLWLKELGANVIGFSNEIPTQPAHFELLKLDIKDVRGDIRNAESVHQAISDAQPDIIFHLAAQPIVRLSYLQPKETFDTNVLGLVNVFEGARKSTSVKAFVNITSDKCYENHEVNVGYKETDPMGGHDPYSASKGCAELVTSSYRRSFFNLENILLASVRAGNVVGGGDWAADRLVPDIFRAAGKQETAKIRNPLAVRPWQHVLEPLSGYLAIGQQLLEGKKNYADSWNFGPVEEDCRTVKEVVSMIQKYWPQVNFDIEKIDNQPHEAGLLKLDISKANALLEWRPVWHFEKTMEITTQWYKDFYSGNTKNNDQRSLEDIKQYIHAAKEQHLTWTN